MRPTTREAEHRVAREWIERLDGLAEDANKNLATCIQRASDPQSAVEDVIAGALVACASQLAYGNAVAAASFYMTNRLWITPEEAP